MPPTLRHFFVLIALLPSGLALAGDGFFQQKLLNGKYGIIFTEGYGKKEKWVVKAEYDSIVNKEGSQNPWYKDDKDLLYFFYLLYKDGQVGVFRNGTNGDKDWDIVLKCQYDQVVMQNGMCAVRQGHQWGLFDAFKPAWLLQPEYDAIGLDPYDEQFSLNATATKSGKTGLYEIRAKTWVLPMEYDEVMIGKGNLMLTRRGQQRGVFFSDSRSTVEPPYRHWIIPEGSYSSFSQPAPRFVVADSLGRKGLWYNHSEKRLGERLIPLQYTDISPMEGIKDKLVHYFVADSLGKKGLWIHRWYPRGIEMVMAAEFDEIFYHEPQRIVVAKLNGQQGLYSLTTGWKTRPNASYAKLKNYTLFGGKLAIGYTPGKGFTVSSDAGGTLKSVEIADKIRYDSFGLVMGNLLVAFKGGLTSVHFLRFAREGKTDVPGGSQLLAEGLEYCCLVYPPKKDQQETLIENQAIMYQSRDTITWWTAGALGTKAQPLTRIPISVDKYNDHFIKHPAQALGSPLILVNRKNRYGIVNLDGQVIVPFMYASFQATANSILRFPSPIPGKFRLFDAGEAGRLTPQNMDPEWRGLTWATVNGKKTGDFDSVVTGYYHPVYKIDTGWYFVQNHQARHTRVLYEGDIKEQFTQGNAQYVKIEKATGTGLVRNGRMLFPATMLSIYATNGILEILDKNSIRLALPLSAINDQFDPAKGYTYHDPNKKCQECHGVGRVKAVITTTTPASTTYSTKEVLVDKPNYGSLSGKRRTSIEYETTSRTTKARTETSTEWVPCSPCQGKGKTPGNVTYTLHNGSFKIT